MPLRASLMFAAGLVLSATALAHDYQLDDVRISHPFATPAPPSVPHAAAYVDIRVDGSEPAVLVGARSPASETVELHDMAMDDGVMQMRRVERIDIPAGTLQTMRPGGGYHLMLFDLVAPLNDGDRFPLTLEFAERGEIEVEVWVQSAGEGSEDAADHHH
ncbi:copper chaperone PCu(A)C [Halomonas sp. EGI 63088]|uniref:Copper chaperone PCu(A)C n=1 Tax=Halomonas flagellata TaxID=2920385 RepID=A0ABS9RTQ2_9GAMM|nr:copper chaperone PCu(A)C [Halomonas flagellata]MCH4563226.1 copper chaperone PCu(A)C [Halomonas flagellata]